MNGSRPKCAVRNAVSHKSLDLESANSLADLLDAAVSSSSPVFDNLDRRAARLRNLAAHASSRQWLPRATVADSLLIFFTEPEAAEVLVGDLMERMVRVRARKSALLTWFWFWWQVFWIAAHQALARVRDKTVLGKLGDAIIRRIGG